MPALSETAVFRQIFKNKSEIIDNLQKSPYISLKSVLQNVDMTYPPLNTVKNQNKRKSLFVSHCIAMI